MQVGLRDVEEGQRFADRPRTDLARPPCGQVDKPCDIAADEFLTNGAGERGTQDLAHDVHVADGLAARKLIIEERLDNGNRKVPEPVMTKAQQV